MSNVLEIQEKLQDTNAAIAQLERAMAVEPESLALSAVGKSLAKRQRTLESEFLAVVDSLGVDVCSYRLFGEHARPTITALSNALGDFQTLVSVVFDAIKTSLPKMRARVSAESAMETAFRFGYAFPGSLGIVLTLPNERLLFGESKLDESIFTIFDMAKASDSSQILKFAKRLGPAPIRAMYKWARDQAQSGLGVEIEWRRDRDVRAKLLVQRPEFEHLQRLIDETSQETREEITVTGQLVGADVERRSFHMRLESDTEIRGFFTDAIGLSHTVELPKLYRANITKTVTIRYSTEEEDIHYHLLRLEPRQ